LLSKLRCPATRSPLVLRDGSLVAEQGGLRYAVTEDGIPDLFAPSKDGDQRKVEEANVAFHDGHAEVYDRQTVRPEEDYAAVSETLGRLCREHGSAKELLDAGCGSGVVLRRGKEHFANILGVDVSLGMLRRSLPVHRDLARASVLALPMADASVDAVTGYSLLHHLHDPSEAFREFHRVLRPGGFLYTDNDSSAAFHARFGWWIRIRRAAKPKRSETEEAAALEKLAECHHDDGLDPEALRRGLLDAGFARAEVVHAHPPRPDEFTRLLMQLQQVDPSPTLYYYFRLIAWK
jgi:prepilin-type processing-associated H-X9-DG protein